MTTLTHQLLGFWRELVKTLKLIARNKMGFLGFILLLALILMSYVGPLVVPPDRLPPG